MQTLYFFTGKKRTIKSYFACKSIYIMDEGVNNMFMFCFCVVRVVATDIKYI